MAKIKKLKTKLSDDPAVMLKQAVSDLKAAIKAGYDIDMSDWYRKDYRGCHVCLAGAALIRRHAHPRDGFDLDKCKIKQKLLALDDFRCGLIYSGLARLGLQEVYGASDAPDLDISSSLFENDPEKFFQAMEGVIEILKVLKKRNEAKVKLRKEMKEALQVFDSEITMVSSSIGVA